MPGGYVTRACIVNNPSAQVARCVAAHGHTPNPAVAPHSRPPALRRPGRRRSLRRPRAAARARRINPWLSMITQTSGRYSNALLTSKAQSPLLRRFHWSRNYCFRGNSRCDPDAPGAPPWQHGGMSWRTAGGQTGFIAARAREGAERSGAPSKRLPAGNFPVFSQPPGYLMALCYFSAHFCFTRNAGGPRGPRHERTTGILTVWAGAPRMTWTVS